MAVIQSIVYSFYGFFWRIKAVLHLGVYYCGRTAEPAVCQIFESWINSHHSGMQRWVWLGHLQSAGAATGASGWTHACLLFQEAGYVKWYFGSIKAIPASVWTSGASFFFFFFVRDLYWSLKVANKVIAIWKHSGVACLGHGNWRKITLTL